MPIQNNLRKRISLFMWENANNEEKENLIRQEYREIGRTREVREEVEKLRKKFLRYQEAEVVYSISHRKLIELSDRAGALYRIDGTVLINRDIFEAFLENFHESNKGIEKRGLGKAERAQKETEKRAVSCGCIQTNWMMRILNLCGTAFSAMQRESPIIA
ncbi:DUF6462 family protein [Stomatobaculum longum]|uniref:DUF6462 family protein n=1 Tax=Stomatobaculum longum TaxID=796942 RepID=UPI002804AC91|nr:DUF6462 family protein [Stomatobaculum longum]